MLPSVFGNRVVSAILQITPTLPPAVNGLGDYSAALAQVLQDCWKIDSAYLIADPCWANASSTKIAVLKEPSATRLANLIDSSSVLLQYVGYAYDKRGAPTWLPAGLGEAKKRNPSLRLVTMFHELYAFGPPWRSSFWLSPLQRRIVKQLLALSDAVVTNCPLSAPVLARWAAQQQIHTLATPSTIGEPMDVPPIFSREPVLAIFGQATGRSLAWRALQKNPSLLQHLGIQEIWDIGPGHIETPGAQVKRFGQLEHAQISSLLLRARYGLISNPWRRLSRSSVLAAYTSHGLVPIVQTDEEDTCPTLEPTRHFLPASLIAKPIPVQELIKIAAAGRHWYFGHSVNEHARLFASLLEAGVPA